MLYPLTFEPLYKERVWGGRKLGELYGKQLPAGAVIGESWEVADRPGDVSVIENGPLAGRDLRWLMEHHAGELLGAGKAAHGRFPLLVKILDAREKLSLQVHPPSKAAAALGGEPKTEMWYITDADPGAELYVGLRRGLTREDFERHLGLGDVAQCFHRVPVRSGDAMFLPSGRVHAIGAGMVLFEIQQNSDTTYRVYDWNRVGLDGKPRQLHVRESLASIQFDDFEPALAGEPWRQAAGWNVRSLVQDPLFQVEEVRGAAGGSCALPGRTMHLLGVVSGKVNVAHADTKLGLAAGRFCLVPASLEGVTLESAGAATVLTCTISPG